MFYETGLQLYRQNRIREAVNVLKRALENPEEERIGACYYLAQCFKEKDKAKYKEYLLQSMRYGEPSPEVCCELGMLSMENEQYEAAIPLFVYAATKTTGRAGHFSIKNYWDFVPYLELSVCYDRLGEGERAYHYHRLAAAIYPDAPAVRHNEEYYNGAPWVASQQIVENLVRKKQRVIELRKEYEKAKMPGVSMVVVTNKKKYMDNIFENYKRIQYKKKEMLLILNSNEISLSQVKNQYKEEPEVQIVQFEEEVTLGECLNYGALHASYEYVAKIDDDDYYGANYLLDMVIASMEFESDVIIKTAGFVYFEKTEKLYEFIGYDEYQEVFGGFGGTIIAKRHLFEKYQFPEVSAGVDVGILKVYEENGIKVYSADRFNYVYKRHKSVKDHTWAEGDEFLFARSTLIQYGKDIEDLITV